MDLTLSVFFNIDRTYLTIVERTKKGLQLVYINSTANPINIEHLDEPSFIEASEEVTSILTSLDADISRLTCTIPAETALVSLFPGREGISDKELKQLVNLEIKQSYPQFEVGNFSTTVIPLAPMLNKRQMVMAVILLKQDFEIYKKLLSPINLPVDSVEISQLNAHSAFIYNYPEVADKNIALMGIQSRFIDVSLMTNKEPLYYNLISLTDLEKFGESLEKEFNKLTSDFIKNLDGLYFFGAGLKSEHIEIAKDKLSNKIPLIGRLNAFRMMTTALESRDREYCSRVSHIFPPCIGGCFPSYHERFKLV